MEKKQISAKIIADSIDSRGNRITTYLLTYPRFIHSELMTHRMFSRNSASSRAIPFEKMVQMVEEDPFTPIAWQKDHPGMQGTEYFTDKSEIDILKDNWMTAKDRAVTMAKELHLNGLTKQLCNRLLEPFMWHTTLITATEYEDFFELRCPSYVEEAQFAGGPYFFRSKKDYLKLFGTEPEAGWYSINVSPTEIHMQALAEAMWGAYNESVPKELKAGEWHIPFGDRIDVTTKSKIVSQENNRLIEKYDNPMSFSLPTIDLRALIKPLKVKIATARCARLSYMTFDGEIDYEKDIELHDRLLASHHMSPFEHCARAMSDLEYYSFIKGKYPTILDAYGILNYECMPLSTDTSGLVGYEGVNLKNPDIYGWCDNLRGFISYRHLIENM